MSYLAIYRDGSLVVRRELSGPVVVGRGGDADVVVPDTSVSRRHCRVEPEGEAWVVVDLGSRNGTVVEGRRVERHVLREGDELKMGDVVLRLHAGKMPPNRPPDPEAALEALRASGEAGWEKRLPESWDGPLPKPQGRLGYPGQGSGGGDDVPTGSTVLGYRREGSEVGAARSQPKGPPPEMRREMRET